jgi:regulatory protein
MAELDSCLLASRPPCFYPSLVFPKPRNIDTEPALYEAAIKILMRRAHSVYEMKKALIRRTPDEDLIKRVIDRLKQNGLMDDARYAKQFACQRTDIRRQGKYRIARDLRARGIPDHHIDSAIAESANPEAERAQIRHRIERKLKLTRGEIDEKKIASLYRSLLRAGFPADAIRQELRNLTRDEIPESDPSEDSA